MLRRSIGDQAELSLRCSVSSQAKGDRKGRWGNIYYTTIDQEFKTFMIQYYLTTHHTNYLIVTLFTEKLYSSVNNL